MNNEALKSEYALYKKMYYHLFNAVTDALNSQTKNEADRFLKKAQIETEYMYINNTTDLNNIS